MSLGNASNYGPDIIKTATKNAKFKPKKKKRCSREVSGEPENIEFDHEFFAEKKKLNNFSVCGNHV